MIRSLPKSDETIYFRLRDHILTDGSQVNDVVIVHDVDDERFGGTLVLPARTITDAIALQKKIWDAIKEHTNESIEYLED